ncbi:MAG: peptidase E [Candidatus Eremiobacteraeota bacterium]|nr:peptidase E [Candidatus Eremiobacteraeota bacterium]
MAESQIVAIGGGVLVPETANFKLERYVLDACGAAKPRVTFVPTASGDDAGYVARFYESYARFGVRVDVLRFFRRTPQDLRAYLLDFDVVHVGGGNTRSMLAVWRHWGFDSVLREAWERGVLLCGSSAGSICWFERALTDSVAGDLESMDGLGFLAGSNCPHYDAEKERRPAYRRLVASGELPAGIACDDGAALHFRGTSLARAVSARPNARAYRVARTPDGSEETALEVEMLR